MPVISVAKVQPEDSASDRLLSQAAIDLAERINNSLAKHHRPAERDQSKNKGQTPVSSHRVAYEPAKAVFDEFLRTKKERWARFAWMNGKVLYFGDPSLPHEKSISDIWDMIKNSVFLLLSRTPLLSPAMEKMLTRYRNQNDIANDDRESDNDNYDDEGEDDSDDSEDTRFSNRLARGIALCDLLFTGGLSTAVEGLDGSILEKPRPEVARRSKGAITAAWCPSPRQTMVKQLDLLLLYRIRLSTDSIGIACEVAYDNEELDLAMRESLLWKEKANISLTVKIDARIKNQSKVDWSSSKQRSSIDPLITMFLVRDPKDDAEKQKWGGGPVRLQLAIGRGSGVRVTRYTRALLREQAKNSPILARVVENVDWKGTQVIEDPEWTKTQEGFEQEAVKKIFKVPFKSVIAEAFHRMSDVSGVDNGVWPEDVRSDFVTFVDGAQLKLDAEKIRGAVILSCFAELRESLSPEERPPLARGPDPSRAMEDEYSMDEDEYSAIAPSSVRGESPLVGLGFDLS